MDKQPEQHTYLNDQAHHNWRRSRTQKFFRTRNLFLTALLLCAIGLVLHLANHLNHQRTQPSKPKTVTFTVALPQYQKPIH